MVIFSDARGTTKVLQYSSINQGSTNANEIVLVAPFAKSCAVYVSYSLPNGMYTAPDFAQSSDYRLTLLDLSSLGISDADGNVLNAWHIKLKSPVTQIPGNLGFQFTVITADGEKITTSNCTIPVNKGSTYILPDDSLDALGQMVAKAAASADQAKNSADLAAQQAKIEAELVKAETQALLDEVEDKMTYYWNVYINSTDEENTFASQLSKASGLVLVSDIEIPSGTYRLNKNITRLVFKNCTYAKDGVVFVGHYTTVGENIAMGNSMIEGVDSYYVTLQYLSSVQHCKCSAIKHSRNVVNCVAGTISHCTVVTACKVNTSVSDCKLVSNIANGENVSYLNNQFIDTYTCEGYAAPTGAKRTWIIKNDGSREAADLVQSLSLTIDNNYNLIVKLLDSTGATIKSSSVSLPARDLIVSGEYDENRKDIVLTLNTGNKVYIPLDDMIEGLVGDSEFSTAMEALEQSIYDKITAETDEKLENVDTLISEKASYVYVDEQISKVASSAGGYTVIDSYYSLSKLPSAKGKVFVKDLTITRSEIDEFNNKYYTGNLIPYPYAAFPSTFKNTRGELSASQATVSATFTFVNASNSFILPKGTYVFKPNCGGGREQYLNRTLTLNGTYIKHGSDDHNWTEAEFVLSEDTEITSFELTVFDDFAEAHTFTVSPVLYPASADSVEFKERQITEISTPIPTKFNLSCDTIEFVNCVIGDETDTEEEYIEFVGGENTSLRGWTCDLGACSIYTRFSHFGPVSNVYANITLNYCSYISNCAIERMYNCSQISSSLWIEGDSNTWIDPISCSSSPVWEHSGQIPLIPDPTTGEGKYLNPEDLGKPYYDHIITTEEEFAKLGTLKGRILVKGFEINNPHNIELSDVSLLELLGSFDVNAVVTIRGNGAALRGGVFIISEYNSLSFSGFNSVENVVGNVVTYSELMLNNCKHISASEFSGARSCDYIDNCKLIGYDNCFFNCNFICGEVGS